uniref:Uncharacterized protein n=1 Tax=Oryza meridionalis TaxID=40149 RepID=A0A0E0BXC3_9ORYZ
MVRLGAVPFAVRRGPRRALRGRGGSRPGPGGGGLGQVVPDPMVEVRGSPSSSPHPTVMAPSPSSPAPASSPPPQSAAGFAFAAAAEQSTQNYRSVKKMVKCLEEAAVSVSSRGEDRVLFYDADTGGAPMNFRDVFVYSQALMKVLHYPCLCLTGGK